VFFFYFIEQHSKFLLHTLYIPELKVRIRTSIEAITADMLQFGTNSIIVLMFVESQRVHI